MARGVVARGWRPGDSAERALRGLKARLRAPLAHKKAKVGVR